MNTRCTNLRGVVQAATSDEFYNLDSHPEHYVVSSGDDSSYTYQFRMDLSSPLNMYNEGQAIIDECITFDSGASPTNYTWYGIGIQLPEDAKSIEGSWQHTPAQPLKKDGYKQLYNDTAEGVAKYNFTTSADRPVIRARVNNALFWHSFVFDVTDGSSNYAEQKVYYSQKCITSRTYTSFVSPTLTVSLERLSVPSEQNSS
eukprot:scaffold18493_cov135-Skeletonema_dohrnii-CCMP3373.AAC.2